MTKPLPYTGTDPKKRPRKVFAEHPTSILLPADMRAGIERERQKRGNIPFSNIVRIALAEFLERADEARREKRRRKPQQDET